MDGMPGGRPTSLQDSSALAHVDEDELRAALPGFFVVGPRGSFGGPGVGGRDDGIRVGGSHDVLAYRVDILGVRDGADDSIRLGPVVFEPLLRQLLAGNWRRSQAAAVASWRRDVAGVRGAHCLALAYLLVAGAGSGDIRRSLCVWRSSSARGGRAVSSNDSVNGDPVVATARAQLAHFALAGLEGVGGGEADHTSLVLILVRIYGAAERQRAGEGEHVGIVVVLGIDGGVFTVVVVALDRVGAEEVGEVERVGIAQGRRSRWTRGVNVGRLSSGSGSLLASSSRPSIVGIAQLTRLLFLGRPPIGS